MSMMRQLVAWALAGAAAIVLVACGGSHGVPPTSSAATGSARTTAPPAATTTADGPTTTANGPTTTGGGQTATTPSGQAGDWPTYHRTLARTGVAGAGPALGHAHELWTASVDGAVYAEPLVVGDTVIVATENDSMYALNAASGRQLWHTDLGTPVPGGDLPCGNIDPSGITGTPVIDTRTGTVYAVTFERFEHRLVAVDLLTGRVRWQRPIDPPGADPHTHQQRAALALSGNRVLVAYGGLYGDCGDYHGWVLAAPASGPMGQVLGYEVPTAREGAIWAPSGPAVDPAGNVYVATGNGASATTFDFGNAVIRLTPTLRVTGFFAPSDAPALSGQDLDLGSTGPLLLPGNRAFIIGKTGIGYLVNSESLGGIGNPVASARICGAAFGGDAYANGTIYVPCTDGIVAVRVADNELRPGWRQGAAQLPPILAGPGLWALSADGTLDQLDPQSGRVRFSATIGDPAHFATPTAAGGRIFVAAEGKVFAFG